jgi:hypothetical protein
MPKALLAGLSRPSIRATDGRSMRVALRTALAPPTHPSLRCHTAFGNFPTPRNVGQAKPGDKGNPKMKRMLIGMLIGIAAGGAATQSKTVWDFY